MNNLIEFLPWLRAQLDTDERTAREGIPFGTGRWIAEGTPDGAKLRDSWL